MFLELPGLVEEGRGQWLSGDLVFSYPLLLDLIGKCHRVEEKCEGKFIRT